MNATVTINEQTGMVRVTLPDRILGGNRESIDMTMLDLIQLQSAIGYALTALAGKPA